MFVYIYVGTYVCLSSQIFYYTETPQVPASTTVSTLLRTETKAILRISWTITTPYNYDLEHYMVTIDGNTRARVKETSTLVEVSMSTDMEYTVSVSVTTVDKCGQQSGAGVALHTVPAITDPLTTDTNIVATGEPVVDPGTFSAGAADQRSEGI